VSAKTFDLPVAVTLRLQSRSGRVDVIAEPRDDVEAEGDKIESLVEDSGATLRIRNGSGTKGFTVRCPIGSDVTVGTQSGAVRMAGAFGSVSVTTMSGSIEVERADEADLRTVTSTVSLGSCAGRCRISSTSGRVVAGDVGAASAGTMSGSITIGHVAGRFKAKSVSGSIRAGCGGEGAVAIKTVSGAVHIELPRGIEPHMRARSLSGRIRCDLAEGDDMLIEAMSVSGSIEVVPA